MTSYHYIPNLVRNTVLALVAAAGVWLGATLAQQNARATGTVDAVADGGQWGNKGGRGICG